MKIEKIYDKQADVKQVIFQRQPTMTWGDFKEAVEKAGVKDEMRMEYIDISDGTTSCSGLQVDINTYYNRFSID